jgi:methylated-DNA-[protein]-cysteine S-methyltransferase
MQTTICETPIGNLVIEGDELGVSLIIFSDDSELRETKECPKFLEASKRQLKEYFTGERKTFDLKLNPKGTHFQHNVWSALQTIPFGKTKSYQQMANQLGKPKVIRAAAFANGKNPISIIIPCHSAIGSDGSLTGYAGGLHRKKWLLEFESPAQ